MTTLPIMDGVVVGPSTPLFLAATTLNQDILDAMATNLGLTNDAFGVARPEASKWSVAQRLGAGSATEAVWGGKPAGSPASGLVCWAGAVGAKTPKMSTLPTDVYGAGYLHHAVAPRGGTPGTWDHATNGPWGAASETAGFERGFQAGLATYCVRVWHIERSDDILFLFEMSDGTFHMSGDMTIDPHTTASAAAEADGRRYASITSGPTVLNGDFQAATGGFLQHTNTANAKHFRVYDVGAATARPLQLRFVEQAAESTTHALNEAGEHIPLDMWVLQTTATRTVGRLRECYYGNKGKMLTRSAPPVGQGVSRVLISSSRSVDDSAMYMRLKAV